MIPHLVKKKDLRMAFVDLVKAFDRCLNIGGLVGTEISGG